MTWSTLEWDWGAHSWHIHCTQNIRQGRKLVVVVMMMMIGVVADDTLRRCLGYIDLDVRVVGLRMCALVFFLCSLGCCSDLMKNPVNRKCGEIS